MATAFSCFLAGPSKSLNNSRPPQFSIKIQSFPNFRPHRRPFPLLLISRASDPSISYSSNDNTPTFLRSCANGAAALVAVGSLFLFGQFVIRPAPALAFASPKSGAVATLYQTMEEMDWRLLVALSNKLMVELPKSRDLWEGMRLLAEVREELELAIPKSDDGSTFSEILSNAIEEMARREKRAEDELELAIPKSDDGLAFLKMLNNALKIARRKKRVKDVRNLKILIAQVHALKGDFEEALRQFQDLVNEDPQDFRPYLCQGLIYVLLEKEEQACKQFETYESLVRDKKD